MKDNRLHRAKYVLTSGHPQGLVEWAWWRRGGRLTCYFFLKRSFKARRGSSGRPDPDVVSRSTVARSEKNVQSLRARLSAMRSGIGWVHSNRWPGAKWVHCWQACSSARHLGHWPSSSVNEGRSVPQSAQRKTVRLGSIPGARVPDDPSGLPPLSFSDSRYPRWPYFLSVMRLPSRLVSVYSKAAMCFT